MTSKIICTVCPNGCEINVIELNTEIYNIKGYKCERGREYAEQEITNPARIITTTIKIKNGRIKRLPVRSKTAVPKNKIFQVMEKIRSIEIEAPVEEGDIIIENVLDEEISIIASKSILNVFVTAAWPGDFYPTQLSFNGGNTIEANSSGQFNNITSEYQNVPVDSTFTITFGATKVFLFRGSWNPDTGMFSAILNRDLVQIQDADGNAVTGVTVSNANDPSNTSGIDATIKVHTNSSLNYDTNYKLVVKKYFSKSSKTNEIKGAVPNDVVIPFKTTALQKNNYNQFGIKRN